MNTLEKIIEREPITLPYAKKKYVLVPTEEVTVEILDDKYIYCEFHLN